MIMHHILLTCFALSCLFFTAISAQAQSLAVGTKAFEAVARSSFLKAGGASTRFQPFYKELTNSLRGKSLYRTELTHLTQAYVNQNISVKRAYEMASFYRQLDNRIAAQLPKNTPFISADKINTIAPAIWRRQHYGTQQQLENFLATLSPYLHRYADVKLTLTEFNYLAEKYLLEGARAVKAFFAAQEARKLKNMTHIQINVPGKPALDVYVFPSQVTKLLKAYNEGTPFTVTNGRVYVQQ